LIAYFIDRHVFTPQDCEPDEELEISLCEFENSIIYAGRRSRTWKKVCDLEDKKAGLDLELFDADDYYSDKEYDEDEVDRLKMKITAIEVAISKLESHLSVAALRVQQRKRDRLLEKKKKHQELMDLCQASPALSLRRAVILSSTAICTDCEDFKNRVNQYFDLKIEMEYV
jgi:hypothetical protein